MESELQVAIDVGSCVHRFAVGVANDHILDQYSVLHTARGMDAFFDHIARVFPALSSGPDCSSWTACRLEMLSSK